MSGHVDDVFGTHGPQSTSVPRPSDQVKAGRVSIWTLHVSLSWKLRRRYASRDIKRGIVETCKDGMMKLSDLRTSEEVLAGALRDPRVPGRVGTDCGARALASQVVGSSQQVCHSERWQTSFICRSPRWLGLKRRSTIQKSRRYGASPVFSTLSSN